MGLRTKEQRQHHLSIIASRYLRGEHLTDIQKDLGVSYRTVLRDVRYLVNKWQESAIKDIAKAKAAEIAKIQEVEKAAWEAWQASKTKTVLSDGAPIDLDDAGNAKFLDIVLSCIDKRLKILGVHDKIDITTNGNDIAQTVIVLPSNTSTHEEISDEEIAEYTDIE